ncbi:LOW QUALITY PROTEIN: uncharacterized protein FN964_007374 [Alca torda]
MRSLTGLQLAISTARLNYYDSIRAVISTSSHESTALVVGAWTPQLPCCAEGGFCVFPTQIQLLVKGRKGQEEAIRRRGQIAMGAPPRRARGDQRVFRAHRGVKAFAFNKKRDLRVTDGGDRVVQLWIPICPGKGPWEPSLRCAGTELGAEGEQLPPENHVPAAGVGSESRVFSADQGRCDDICDCTYVEVNRSNPGATKKSCGMVMCVMVTVRQLSSPQLVTEVTLWFGSCPPAVTATDFTCRFPPTALVEKTLYHLYSWHYPELKDQFSLSTSSHGYLPSHPRTFGQAEPWEVSTRASWKHPPYKILTDPQGLH